MRPRNFPELAELGIASPELVEDDSVTTKFIRDLRDTLDQSIVGIFSRGEDAIDFINENTVDLAIIGISLAGKLSGIDVYNALLVKQPDARAIYVVADPEQVSSDNPQPFTVLTKPFTKKELLSAISFELDETMGDHFDPEGEQPPTQFNPEPEAKSKTEIEINSAVSSFLSFDLNPLPGPVSAVIEDNVIVSTTIFQTESKISLDKLEDVRKLHFTTASILCEQFKGTNIGLGFERRLTQLTATLCDEIDSSFPTRLGIRAR